jgi:hypothetical protein
MVALYLQRVVHPLWGYVQLSWISQDGGLVSVASCASSLRICSAQLCWSRLWPCICRELCIFSEDLFSPAVLIKMVALCLQRVVHPHRGYVSPACGGQDGGLVSAESCASSLRICLAQLYWSRWWPFIFSELHRLWGFVQPGCTGQDGGRVSAESCASSLRICSAQLYWSRTPSEPLRHCPGPTRIDPLGLKTYSITIHSPGIVSSGVDVLKIQIKIVQDANFFLFSGLSVLFSLTGLLGNILTGAAVLWCTASSSKVTDEWRLWCKYLHCAPFKPHLSTRSVASCFFILPLVFSMQWSFSNIHGPSWGPCGNAVETELFIPDPLLASQEAQTYFRV